MVKKLFLYTGLYLFSILFILSGCSKISEKDGVYSDTYVPSKPINLEVNAISSNQIDLEWNASSDNVAVEGYYVYRDGSKIGTSSGTTFSDTGLDPNTEYSYRVAAYDASGNISDQSISEETDTYPDIIELPPATSSIQKPEFSAIIFTDGSSTGTQFPANKIKDFYILVHWYGGNGDYHERLEVYTPEGSLYQLFEKSFTASGNTTEVTVKLPIAGTYITQHAIFGIWTVKVYLDSYREPAAAASFTLQ